MAEIFISQQLENGVRISFSDRTNRYFGDYHRVCVDVLLSFAAQDYTVPHCFKTLESMGVSSAELVTVQQQLFTSFKQHTLPYLSHPTFPAAFLSKCENIKKPLLRAWR